MSDVDLTTQVSLDKQLDAEDTWALKLLQECEQEQSSSQNDDQSIYIENEVQTDIPTTLIKDQSYNVSSTTAIQRQINQKNLKSSQTVQQTEKEVKGFWSLFRKKS